MPHNRNNALRRIKGIETKIRKNKDFKFNYTEQIANLITKGYAEPAISEPTSPRTWYLPHFAVFHPQKGKLRLVFDAAERTNGKSLNDALLSGPDLLQSLFGVLIRFRQDPLAVTANPKEMFLRIEIRPEDRDSLRFLWREKESDKEPKEFRMTSLIFGATSSPCSAIYVKNLDIPRCTNSQSEGELHTFVDASETIYAAATYWKSTDQGKTSVKLIAAKTKVAPLKPTSIPRLELQAALLGCRLATSVTNEMDATIKNKYYWSDSRTVLAWIKSDPRTYKTFVAHRLAEIEDLSKPSEWRYVPTKLNVADDATRTIPCEFNTNHRWFKGPEFLKHDCKYWPIDRSERSLPPTGEERQTVAVIQTNKTSIPDVRRFSSWTRFLRATARLLQCADTFKNLTKKPNSVAATKRITSDKSWKPNNAQKGNKKPAHASPKQPQPQAQTTSKTIRLPNKYIKKAEELIVHKIQTDSFGAELQNLKNGKSLHKQSRLKRLTIALKKDVMHLETRLSAINDIAISYKSPIILDGKHPITRLIIRHYHQEYNHGNHNTVMNELRQKYYITSLRNTIKAIARECQWCRTHKAIPTKAPIGDLPSERLKQEQHPFTCTAVDYFGPITITIGRRTDKRWVALYTCLTTRAVHLEIATSLSSDNMILTLRRMIARRGTPKVMYSDNGTNFIGADKVLRAEFEKMKERTEEKGIQWKFIPPGAPNMGGSWERLVRSVKTALTATLNTRHPQEEILHTLLLEAEHLINSRPR